VPADAATDLTGAPWMPAYRRALERFINSTTDREAYEAREAQLALLAEYDVDRQVADAASRALDDRELACGLPELRDALGR
jgi:hypothetical protein